MNYVEVKKKMLLTTKKHTPQAQIRCSSSSVAQAPPTPKEKKKTKLIYKLTIEIFFL